MAVQQHETLGLRRAGNVGDQHLLAEPAFLELADDLGRLALGGRRDQEIAIGAVDGDHRDPWFPGEVVETRRAPDGRARPPVDVDAGIDGDDGGGAQALDRRDDPGQGKALGHHHLAGDLVGRQARGIDTHLGNRALTAGGLGGNVQQRGFEAFGHGARERRRLGAQTPVAELDRGLARQAQIKLRLMDFMGHAKRGETLGDHVHGRVDVVRAFAREGRKALDQRPRLVEREVINGLFFRSSPDRSSRSLLPFGDAA